MREGKGPVGALMDEYERASDEFIRLIDSIDPSIYDTVLDLKTEDENCRSVKMICFHVLFAGYNYANSIRRKFDMPISSPERFYPTQEEFPSALSAMLEYTDESIADHYSMTDDELNATNIPIRWSDHHDMEAIFEHAIVHILRHRRQVERLTREGNESFDKRRLFGSGKDIITYIADDFDDPLEEFKEYM
jgi:uncharacterized damage-inducible protein DinB